ncbi:hypothetical protein NDU88_001958, partial [Pleurodeles waltl]
RRIKQSVESADPQNENACRHVAARSRLAQTGLHMHWNGCGHAGGGHPWQRRLRRWQEERAIASAAADVGWHGRSNWTGDHVAQAPCNEAQPPKSGIDRWVTLVPRRQMLCRVRLSRVALQHARGAINPVHDAYG